MLLKNELNHLSNQIFCNIVTCKVSLAHSVLCLKTLRTVLLAEDIFNCTKNCY